MIAKIEGILESIDGSTALIRIAWPSGPTQDMGQAPQRPECGALTYAVLLPAFTVARLGAMIGQYVTLHTLYTIESQGQGTTLLPRLLGFHTAEDRRFFEVFTTCKGIGSRKALRAMSLHTAQIAAAIADRDVATLQSLPEIGRRTAETIVATLHGKVDGFLVADDLAMGSQLSSTASTSTIETNDTLSTESPTTSRRVLARQTLEVLIQLGENRSEALTWIDRVLTNAQEPPTTVEQLLTKVYRCKSGA